MGENDDKVSRLKNIILKEELYCVFLLDILGSCKIHHMFWFNTIYFVQPPKQKVPLTGYDVLV